MLPPPLPPQLSLLLFMEEVQQEQDVRRYDMQGASFEQPGSRKYLILQVGTVRQHCCQ